MDKLLYFKHLTQTGSEQKSWNDNSDSSRLKRKYVSIFDTTDLSQAYFDGRDLHTVPLSEWLNYFREMSTESNKSNTFREGGAYTRSNHAAYLSNFEHAYEDVNQSYGELTELFLPKDSFLKYSGYYDYGHLDTWGVAIYPVLNSYNGDTFFSFILTCAKKVPNTGSTRQIDPIINPRTNQISYILINHPNAPSILTVLSEQEFQNKRAEYLHHVRIKLPGTGIVYPTLTQLNHPGCCFISGSAIRDFHDDNDTFFENGTIRVLFRCIGKPRDGVDNQYPNYVFNLHSPAMVFQKKFVSGARVELLDNDPRGGRGKFTMRALNLGHLCPPDCN